MSSPIALPLTQCLGITLTAFWSGATFSISTFLVPSLLSSPSIPNMLTSWTRMYNLGKLVAPPISILAASSYIYAAYHLPLSSLTRERDFWRYVTAAGFSAIVAPYTVVVMGKTNKELLRREGLIGEGSGKGEGVEVQRALEEERAKELIDWWGVLNLVRAGLLGVSAALGAWTALC